MNTPTPPPILGTPIATGRTAEIFAWGEGRVLKLTRTDFPPVLADQEWRNAQIAWQAGARAPQPIEILEVEGRRGVVFERLDGPTMGSLIRRNMFRLPGYARQLARLQVELHQIPAPGLQSVHERVKRNMEQATYLPEEIKRRVYQVLEELPDGETFCHADFHPENILLTHRGPVIIDWEGSMRGSPVADVAATCLVMRAALTFGKGPKGWFFRQLGRIFERAYLGEYGRLAPDRLGQLDTWIGILALTRIGEETEHILDNLRPLIERALRT